MTPQYPKVWAEMVDEKPHVAIVLWKGNGIQCIEEADARLLYERLADALKTLAEERGGAGAGEGTA